MNGKKILDRLILLFICINIIILVFNINLSYNRYILSGKRASNVLKVLEEQNIIVDNNLPLEFKPKSSLNLIYEINTAALRDKYVSDFFGRDLTTVLRSTSSSQLDSEYKKYNYNKAGETLSFDMQNVYYNNEGIDIDGKPPAIEVAIKYADAWIKRLGIEGCYKNPYIQKEIYDTHIVLTYFPMINNTKVEDIYVEIVVSEDGVRSAEATLGNVQVIKNTQRQIISADRAVFGIREYVEELCLQYQADGIKSQELHIKEIELVYKKESIKDYNVWGNKSIPMYKITIEGLETSVFVNAYTNGYVK